MPIRIEAQGPPASVKRAAARHGIPLRNLRAVRGYRDMVSADAPCSAMSKLTKWMWGPQNKTKTWERKTSPGTLISRDAKSCPASELSGARRRKRKR